MAAGTTGAPAPGTEPPGRAGILPSASSFYYFANPRNPLHCAQRNRYVLIIGDVEIPGVDSHQSGPVICRNALRRSPDGWRRMSSPRLDNGKFCFLFRNPFQPTASTWPTARPSAGNSIAGRQTSGCYGFPPRPRVPAWPQHAHP